MAKKVKIKFCGGAEVVTGSNFLLEDDNGLKVLVDAGLYQGPKAIEDLNYAPWPYDVTKIDYLFITHAHLDHIGRVGKLVKDGFRGKIISTPPTKEIAELIMADAIGVQHRNHQHDEGSTELYDEKDISQAMRQWETLIYHQPIKVGDFDVVLRDSGHIMGASMVEFTYKQQKIVFTGDLGNSPSPLLRDTEKLTDTTYLIMESVYGDRNHEDRGERQSILEDIIERTAKRGGAVLIPVFSIERTQELLFEIENMMENSAIPLVPVFLDSPLAIDITAVYKKYEDYFNKDAKAVVKAGDGLFKFPQFHETMTTDESKAIDQSTPRKIILAGSGMSNGGRIIHHEKKYLPDPNSTLLLAGYQSVGTLGRLIQDGAKSVKIMGEEVPVRAEIVSISGYSAHKDFNGLFAFVKDTADTVKKVFVAMGEPKASAYLTQRIRDYLGIDAHAPKANEVVELTLTD